MNPAEPTPLRGQSAPDTRTCTESCPCRRGERMFTFSTRSYRPERKVTCHHCGWTATGRTARTFEKADTHECERSA